MNVDLFRYEENFFNCRNAQIVMYLRSKNVPVDFYFYNSFEDTGDIYRHIFVDDRNRWLFMNRCLRTAEDYGLLGVEIDRVHCPDFQIVKELVDERRNASVFVWLNNYYIPHKEHYAKEKAHHSYIIHDRKKEGRREYLVQDPPKFLDYIDEDTIGKAYEDGTDMFKIVTAPVVHPADPDRREIADKFAGWARDFQDDFSFYDHARQMVSEIADSPNDSWSHRKSVLEKLRFAFSMIFSSRFLFARFLEVMSMNPEWVDTALRCSKASESIRGYLNKAMFSRRLNDAVLNEKIAVLQEEEAAFVDRLKEYV